MTYAKALPFIYTDTFIAIAIVIMVLLAVISFVFIPLFFLKKTPNRDGRLITDKDFKLVLNEELQKYFASITIKNRVVTFVHLPGIEKVRVALRFPSAITCVTQVYNLDFTKGDELTVVYPGHHKMLSDLFIVDNENRDSLGQPLLSLKRSRLLVFSIASGLTLGISIFLSVLIFSTHLRKVDPTYVGYYFFALIGLAIIPIIFFSVLAINKKLERRGK